MNYGMTEVQKALKYSTNKPVECSLAGTPLNDIIFWFNLYLADFLSIPSYIGFWKHYCLQKSLSHLSYYSLPINSALNSIMFITYVTHRIHLINCIHIRSLNLKTQFKSLGWLPIYFSFSRKICHLTWVEILNNLDICRV